MVKITFWLSIFCVLFWKIDALQMSRECEYINEHDSSFFISKRDSVIHCNSLDIQHILHRLPRLAEYDIMTSWPINLQLTNIAFNSDRFGYGEKKMKMGWFDIEKLLVKSLQLEGLQIVEIEDKSFLSPSFETLEQLYILDMPLQILNEGMFTGLNKLTSLKLKRLKIKVIEKNVLAPMPDLKMFHFEDCGTEKIWLDHLFGGHEMRNLNKIDVLDCNLNDTITEKTFSSISNVTILNLSKNEIKKIGPKSFDIVFKTLNSLYLRNNKLENVPENLFNSRRQISIQLTLNHWRCDCEMEHLRLFDQITKTVSFHGLICFTPRSKRGKNLKMFQSLCNRKTNDDTATKVAEQQEIESFSVGSIFESTHSMVFTDSTESYESTNSTESFESINSTDLTESNSISDEEIFRIKLITSCILLAFFMVVLFLIILLKKIRAARTRREMPHIECNQNATKNIERLSSSIVRHTIPVD